MFCLFVTEHACSGKRETIEGTVVSEHQMKVGTRFALIRDPAGAVCALYRPQAP